VDSDGDVGIGVSSPGGKLEVNGAVNVVRETDAFNTSSTYTSFVIGDLSGANGPNGGLYAFGRYDKSNEPFAGLNGWDGGASRRIYIGGGGWNVPDATEIKFYAAPSYDETDNAGVEMLRIDSTGVRAFGPVYMGTSTPAYGFHVVGDDVATDNYLRVRAFGVDGGDNTYNTGTDEWNGWYDGRTGKNYLKVSSGLYLGNAADGNLYLDGNAGIGTTSPAEEFEIEKSDADLLVESTGDNWTTLTAKNTGAATDIETVVGSANSANNFGYAGTVSNHDFRLRTSGSDRVTVDNTGNVGVGTSDPQGLVHLSGGDAWGGLVYKTFNVTAAISAFPNVRLETNIPAGARISHVQLRVDSALQSGNEWDANWNDGTAIQTICTNQSIALNTKVDAFFDPNGASPIRSSETDIFLSKNGGGDFTAQGTIRAVGGYWVLDPLADN
jgi:hypothetical protein